MQNKLQTGLKGKYGIKLRRWDRDTLLVYECHPHYQEISFLITYMLKETNSASVYIHGHITKVREQSYQYQPKRVRQFNNLHAEGNKFSISVHPWAHNKAREQSYQLKRVRQFNNLRPEGNKISISVHPRAHNKVYDDSKINSRE